MTIGKFCLACAAMGLVFSNNLFADTASLKAVADTNLKELEPAGPQGVFATLNVGTLSATRGGSTRNRSLFRFDPSTNIPAGAIITSAQLTLNVYSVADPTPYNFDLRKISVSWTENEATWNGRNAANDPWSAPGGAEGTDFSATASASLALSSTGANTFTSTANMVADVQSWLDNPPSNFGWMLVTTAEATPRSARRVIAREGEGIFGANTVPTLVLEYTTVPEPGTITLAALGAAGWAVWRARRSR